MFGLFRPRGLGTVIMFGALAVVSACSGGTTATSAGGGGTPAATATTAPTATPLPSCATALPGSASVGGPIAFADAPTPVGAVAVR